ncbi:unnamed protein product [Mesocestoides corti]|uniref:Major facilitator superfamily (MFS) profile domain-containing protein n=1 Tax=Mesocestoides corti TaxID=53468 RepID=A0A0R3UFU8_MESCO|nr:unnamed protein product [Mesocestoides corti]
MKALFLGCCLLYASRNVLPVCSSEIALELKWTRQDEASGEFVLPFTTFIWGFTTVMFVLLPLVSSQKDVIFHFFLLARFLLGIFQGFFYPGLASLMAKRVQTSERQFTYAFITSGSHAGPLHHSPVFFSSTLFCGFVGSFLTEFYDWRIPFFLIGCFALLWATFVIRKVYTIDGHSKGFQLLHLPLTSSYKFFGYLTSLPVHDVETGLVSKVDKTPVQTPHPPSDAVSWGRLTRQPAFWAMLLGNFVFNNTFYIILNWLPSYFHDNYPDAKSWIFNVVPWLIVVPCALLGGLMADRLITQGFSVTFVRKLISSIALLGTSLFLVLLPVFEGFYSSLLCMALAIACCGFHNSGILLNPQDIAPMHGGQVFGESTLIHYRFESRLEGLCVMSTIGTIPGFTGVYFTGYVLEKSRCWSTVFQCAATGNLLGWIVYIAFGSSRPLI